jgi:hypothetical protein
MGCAVMHDIFQFQDIAEGQAAGDACYLSVSGLNRRTGWAVMHDVFQFQDVVEGQAAGDA